MAQLSATSLLSIVGYLSVLCIVHPVQSFSIDNSQYVINMQQESLTYDKPNYYCVRPDPNERFDCFPGKLGSATEEKCEARGCCWAPPTAREHSRSNITKEDMDVPWCYFPSDYNGYGVTDFQETPLGYKATLTRTSESGWPGDIKELTLEVMYETENRLHFKIFDAKNKRYEVPLDTPKVSKRAPTTAYTVKLRDRPFGITVYRKSGEILFDTAMEGAPLIFADQFIQISTHTGTGLVYGMGEHKTRLLHPSDTWDQLAFWNRDRAPSFNANLYGTHPFYLNIEDDGKSHGVFLLNSNAMEITFQPLPAITYRTIGGILDFYVFTGPSPTDVIEQYTDVIGKPFMPPYWSLGFHLCRYGYGSSAKLKEVIERNRKLLIPYEVQWTDIDYMDRKKDWTYDKTAFTGLPQIVADLHDHGQRYIVIIDPGISNLYPGQYAPYDEGIKDDIFVKNASNQVLIGSVWPGSTAFPDFSNPKTADWWYRQAKYFHDQVPFDGLWIDMNDPSNFVFGSLVGCTNNTLDNPPYTPWIDGDTLPEKTVCPSAQQFISSHYNLHNMYGHMEAVDTNYALKNLLGNRSIIISRSSFPGTGHFSGVWTGDISATWQDLYYSIPAILNFGMYGIPLIGADICGFAGNTTEELCVRWMQLGSFYPFMRNHNDDVSMDQDPAVFSHRAQKIMKMSLELRYALLPYLYTLFHQSHESGRPVARPLFFKYPTDPATYDLDTQFMWGEGLLISPALTQGQTQVKAYFPSDIWYDIYDSNQLVGTGNYVMLQAPLEKINVHVRGGVVIPVQQPAVTTNLSRHKPFGLLVALNKNGEAFGSLFWDDGESFDTHKKGVYTGIQFIVGEGELRTNITHAGYKPADNMMLQSVRVMGVAGSVTEVHVNGKSVQFIFHADNKELQVEDVSVSLLSTLVVQWTMKL